jgi:hypothetical protein
LMFLLHNKLHHYFPITFCSTPPRALAAAARCSSTEETKPSLCN